MSAPPDNPEQPSGGSTEAPGSARASFLALFPSIMLPMFLGILDQTIVATALPAIAADLGNVELIAWIVVAYLIATATAAPVYGRLGDAFGRRKLLIISLMVAMTGSALCAFAVSTEMLIAARVLQGLGGGGLISLSQALIGQSVPPRERAQYQGYISAVAVIASTVGPVIGGLLTEFLGWRAIFFFNIPFGLLAIALLMRLPPGTGQKEPFRFDWLGLILFASFVWSTLILVEALRGHGPGSLGISAMLVVIAVVAMIALYLREKRVQQPLLPVTLLENPSIWRADALAMSHGALFVSLIAFVPIYLRAVHGASAAEIGLMMLPMTAGVGFGGFIVGQVVSKTGRTAIFPSLGLMIVGVMLLFLAFFAPLLSMLQFAWYLGALSVFLGTVMGVVQVTVQSEAGKKMLGAAAASVAVSRSFGAALGTAIVGAVLFAAVAATGVEVAGPLEAVLQGSETALAGIDARTEAEIRAAVSTGFRSVFLIIFVFSVIGSILSWTIPRRMI
ncbi:MAG: MFS transporter [Salinarimonas sp.]